MNPFQYDEFYFVFMKEIKPVFSNFISCNKDKKPYIFTISANEYTGNDHPTSYSISANGNTIVDFESDGHSLTNEDDLYYKYYSEEWDNNSFTSNDFTKSNRIILDYMIEIESQSSYDDSDFIEFRTKIFDFIIKCLQQLRSEKFFSSIYQEKILINFEVREYYNEYEMISIFERLNEKEDVDLFSKWL